MTTTTAHIHLRTTISTKSLLAMAAEISGATNLTDYILHAAVDQAWIDLSRRQTFELGNKPWNEFAKRLDSTARDLPRLRKLLIEEDFFGR